MKSRRTITLAVGFLALCVLVLAGNRAHIAYLQLQEAQRVARLNSVAEHLVSMTRDIALERGSTAALLGTRGTPSAATANRIRALRARVDDSWQQALKLVKQTEDSLLTATNFKGPLDGATTAYAALLQARLRVDQRLLNESNGMDGTKWIGISASFIQNLAQLREVVFGLGNLSNEITRSNAIINYNAWVLSEQAGQERAFYALHISSGRPLTRVQQGQISSIRDVLQYVASKVRDTSNLSGVDQRIVLAIGTMEREYFQRFGKTRAQVAAASAGNYPLNSEEWMRAATAGIDSILAVVSVSSQAIREEAQAGVQRAQGQMLLQLVIAFFALVAAIVCIIRVKRTADTLFLEKELAEVTLHSIGDAVITTDALGRVQHLNPIAETLTGWSSAEAKGQPLMMVFNIVNGVTRERQIDPVEKCIREKRIVGLENNTVLIARDGTERVIEDSAAPVRDREQQVVGAVVVFYDVTLMRNSGHLLSYHATHDALTGLVNRREFERHLTRLVESAKIDRKQHVLCYLDLDQFKIVNDTCGHIAGDRLLRQLSHLLRQRIREQDTLARLGGDEFGLLLDSCPPEPALRLANDLIHIVNDFRFVWDNTTFEIGVSIGMVEITPDSPSPVELMSQADTACYSAKDMGRNRVRVYESTDAELTQRQGEMHWVGRIRKALAEDRFALHCQTILPLRDDLRQLHFCETLVRMVSETGEIIPPMAFIPAAERYNLMPAIDRWVFSQALAELATRRNRHSNKTRWFINLSGASLADEGMLDFIHAQFIEHQIEPEEVCIEITETVAVANLDLASKFIRSLKQTGCHFALDDFGSGMSSFAYLKNLPVDYLKIAGTFVQNIAINKTDHAMVDAINHVGHVMGIRTIAEHVENAAIMKELHLIGIDFAQGFAIAKPIALVEHFAARTA